MFVDYSGLTVPIVDLSTGEVIKAQIATMLKNILALL